MFVSTVHIVVFLREFRTESNAALCVVNISYSALSDTFSLFALDLFVDPEQSLNKFAVFVNIMRLHAVKLIDLESLALHVHL